jgi:hypothetical protein
MSSPVTQLSRVTCSVDFSSTPWPHTPDPVNVLPSCLFLAHAASTQPRNRILRRGLHQAWLIDTEQGTKTKSWLLRNNKGVTCHIGTCSLGGVMSSVLAIGPKVREFKPSWGDRFLKAIKFRSTPSFGREEKALVPYRKTLLHVQSNFYMWTKMLWRLNS